MNKIVVCGVVSAALRGEYLLARAIVKAKQPEWSENKTRLFTVRVVSFTHALVSALGCLFSLLTDINYVREPYDYHKQNAEYVFLFSMGYFIYDLLDMYLHGELNSSKEYLVHHSLVITAFSIILFSGRLFGLAMIALLVEVQTVFLHLRTMVRLAYGSKKQSELMDTLINANMICLFLFRHLPICFLLYYLTVIDVKVPIILKLFLVGGLTFLEYHNTHLTMAMAKSDGFFGHERQALDEDSCDPLGSVNKENTKKESKSKKVE
uniref:TLC domain-containing protein n=1 Tax=Caenorhabditis japonica TaxID=281687 RepID=A0A8R1I141_CAEJA